MVSQGLLSHFSEMRKRVLICAFSFIVCSFITYFFYNDIYIFLSLPFKDIKNSINNNFFVSSVIDPVTVKLKFSILSGIILSLPIFTYQILKFVFPGLKKREKKVILVGLFFGLFLGVIGFFYSYFLLIPISLNFLVSKHFVPDTVGLLLTYSDNILFVFNLLAYMILIFQIPIFLWIVLLFKLATRSFVWRSLRVVIILIFALSAILTPPDILTQLMVAVPLCLLFIGSLLLAHIFRIGDK